MRSHRSGQALRRLPPRAEERSWPHASLRLPGRLLDHRLRPLCDPKHPPITEAEAERYLAEDLKVALTATPRYCPMLATEPEGRLAAIVDFSFNLGAGRLQTSTLSRRVNQRDWVSAATELRRWAYGGGKVLPGLFARREAEISLLGT
ncbi:glycoside hydrolase family protein [Ectopseudomonas oleovorans]|uniref:lysozyme n=1 Tax=Ectopseudomonas oleovorans TaxID=301 RepID=UPI0036F23AA9